MKLYRVLLAVICLQCGALAAETFDYFGTIPQRPGSTWTYSRPDGPNFVVELIEAEYNGEECYYFGELLFGEGSLGIYFAKEGGVRAICGGDGDCVDYDPPYESNMVLDEISDCPYLGFCDPCCPSYYRRENEVTVPAGTFADAIADIALDINYEPNGVNTRLGLDPDAVPYAVTEIMWLAPDVGFVSSRDVDAGSGAEEEIFTLISYSIAPASTPVLEYFDVDLERARYPLQDGRVVRSFNASVYGLDLVEPVSLLTPLGDEVPLMFEEEDPPWISFDADFEVPDFERYSDGDYRLQLANLDCAMNPRCTYSLEGDFPAFPEIEALGETRDRLARGESVTLRWSPFISSDPFARVELNVGDLLTFADVFSVDLPLSSDEFELPALDPEREYEVVLMFNGAGKRSETRFWVNHDDGQPRLPGDCNQDSKLDISDGICLLNYLFTGGVAPCEPTAGSSYRPILDFNGDPGVDISDGISVFRYLFLGGPAHALGSECVPIEGCSLECSL